MAQYARMVRDEREFGMSDSEEDSGSDREQASFLDRLMDEDDPWGSGFQMTTAAVILSCTFSMAVEVDYCTDCSFWWWWNSLVLVYFCVELAIRGAHAGWSFFSCIGDKADNAFWNYFDLTIVVICVITLWVEPLVEMGSPGALDILRIFRVFRILRTLRVLRIFKACDQLKQLATGLLVSVGTVFWIALLMFMVMLIFAIILTDVAGNQAAVAVEPGDLFYGDRAEIMEYWGSVSRSLVTLFQMLTLDDWTNISKMVYSKLPAMWFVFFLYIFTMGFAMLSLLTGVVAEHMTEVSTQTKAQNKQQGDVDLKEFLDEKIPPLFHRLTDATPRDADGQLQLDFEQFTAFLQHEEITKQLKELDASLQPHEAREFWNCLERSGDNRLSLPELKAGFLRLRGELQPKDMLRIRYAAERVARTLQGGQGEAATTRKLEEINLDLADVDERLKDMQHSLAGFMDFVQQSCSRQALRRVASNVSGACS